MKIAGPVCPAPLNSPHSLRDGSVACSAWNRGRGAKVRAGSKARRSRVALSSFSSSTSSTYHHGVSRVFPHSAFLRGAGAAAQRHSATPAGSVRAAEQYQVVKEDRTVSFLQDCERIKAAVDSLGLAKARRFAPEELRTFEPNAAFATVNKRTKVRALPPISLDTAESLEEFVPASSMSPSRAELEWRKGLRSASPSRSPPRRRRSPSPRSVRRQEAIFDEMGAFETRQTPQHRYAAVTPDPANAAVFSSSFPRCSQHQHGFEAHESFASICGRIAVECAAAAASACAAVEVVVRRRGEGEREEEEEGWLQRHRRAARPREDDVDLWIQATPRAIDSDERREQNITPLSPPPRSSPLAINVAGLDRQLRSFSSALFSPLSARAMLAAIAEEGGSQDEGAGSSSEEAEEGMGRRTQNKTATRVRQR